VLLARRTLLIAAAIAAISLTAGCGGGKEEVSAAELSQKGDEICREEQRRFDEIQAHPPPNASVAADQTKELVDVADAANSDLGDLEPPDSLQDRYDDYLEARERVVDEMKKGADAAESQNSTAYAAAQRAVAKTNPQRRHLAGSLGFKVCSANPGSV
jgi:uncharacterized sporulation protein YeaH/YhbH (DUF444 family)